MPVIPAPHEHLQAALAAIEEHLDHHAARILHHTGEARALRELRTQYETVLSEALDHIEPSTEVALIPVVEPTFDEVVSTMSGRIPQP